MEKWESYICLDCDAVFEVVGTKRVSEGLFRCPDCLGWSTVLEELEKEREPA